MRNKQTGATLLVGLIIMALLTVVGLAALDVTTVDVKVVANSKDRQLAFNGAEAALFDGGLIVKDNDGALTNASSGFVDDTYTGVSDWWDSRTWTLSYASGTPVGSEYVIEEPNIRRESSRNGVTKLGMGSTGPVTMHGFYPITARSDGPGNAFVLLQSQFVKRLYDNAVN